jgi:O-antigen ligase
MLLTKLFAYIYLLLWLVLAFLPYVYFSTKVYYALLFVFSFTALIFSIYTFLKFNLPTYFKVLFIFVFFLSVYGAYIAFLGEDIYWQGGGRVVNSYDYFLWLSTSMLSSIVVYYFSSRNLLQDVEMKVFFLIAFVSSIYAFQVFLNEKMIEAAKLGLSDEEFTVTCVYSFLSLLPFVVLLKRNVFLQFSSVCAIFIYCVLGVKRGPIFLCIICSLFFVWNLLQGSSIKKKVYVMLLLMGVSIGIYEFILGQIENSPYFALRVEQTLAGDTSGRDSYGKNIIDYYLNHTNIREFFLGIGANQTLSVNVSFAHNDWLGILLEQGLVGVLLYLFYWFGFFMSWLKSKKCKDAFIALGILLLIGIGKSLFSMYYLPVTAEMIISSGFFAISLGYFLGKAYPQENQFDEYGY